ALELQTLTSRPVGSWGGYYLSTEMNKSYVCVSRKKSYWPINIEHAFLSGLHDSDWFCNEYYR
ncbi:hypothetical protein AB6C94_05475, partial [Vibrio splendidus]